MEWSLVEQFAMIENLRNRNPPHELMKMLVPDSSTSEGTVIKSSSGRSRLRAVSVIKLVSHAGSIRVKWKDAAHDGEERRKTIRRFIGIFP